MKKPIVILALMLIMLIPMVLPVNAEETAPEEDSVTISKEILESLPLKNSDQVIRIYELTYLWTTFTQHSNIDEVLTHASELYIHNFYIVKDSTGVIAAHWYVEDRLTSLSSNNSWYADFMNFHLSRAPETIIKEISSNVVVDNMYYLKGNDSNAVYYKTNLGEYVYLTFNGLDSYFEVGEYQESAKEYLLSLTQFLELMKAIRQHQEETALDSWNDVPLIGQSSLFNIADVGLDLSAYEIGSPNFDPNAPFPVLEKDTDDGSKLWLICGISAGVCFLVGGSAFMILRLRKKQK